MAQLRALLVPLSLALVLVGCVGPTHAGGDATYWKENPRQKCCPHRAVASHVGTLLASWA
jgi:hypothetical protein